MMAKKLPDKIQRIFKKNTMRSEYVDNVRCCNCGKRSLVELGSDECPHCGKVGALAWVEGEEQEVYRDHLDQLQCNQGGRDGT